MSGAERQSGCRCAAACAVPLAAAQLRAERVDEQGRAASRAARSLCCSRLARVQYQQPSYTHQGCGSRRTRASCCSGTRPSTSTRPSPLRRSCSTWPSSTKRPSSSRTPSPRSRSRTTSTSSATAPTAATTTRACACSTSKAQGRAVQHHRDGLLRCVPHGTHKAFWDGVWSAYVYFPSGNILARQHGVRPRHASRERIEKQHDARVPVPGHART